MVKNIKKDSIEFDELIKGFEETIKEKKKELEDIEEKIWKYKFPKKREEIRWENRSSIDWAKETIEWCEREIKKYKSDDIIKFIENEIEELKSQKWVIRSTNRLNVYEEYKKKLAKRQKELREYKKIL